MQLHGNATQNSAAVDSIFMWRLRGGWWNGGKLALKSLAVEDCVDAVSNN